MSRGFRIAELSRRSDTPKETIHYYLRIGLLRKPRKTSKNMAYYDDGHVEQLKLIRRLRTESYLPLSVIKKVLKEGKLAESTRRIDLAGDLFGQGAKTEFEPLTAAALADKLETSVARIQAYDDAGLLLPKRVGEERRFGWEDLRIAEILTVAEREAGDAAQSFLLERFQLIERHVTSLVREESAHFFASLIATSDPSRATDLLRGGRDTVGRYLALARVRRLRFEIEALLREVEGALQDVRPDARPASVELPPTKEAAARHAQLAAACETTPNKVSTARALFEHLIGQGGEVEIVERFDALRPKPRADRAIQLIAAEGLLDCNRYDDAVRVLEPIAAEDAEPDAAVQLILSSATLGRLRDRLLASASTGDEMIRAATSSYEVIGDLVNGLSFLYRAQDAIPIEPGPRATRWRLLLGRIQTAMPAFLGRGGAGRQQLREVIADVERLRDGPRDPGFGVLTRLEWNAARALARRARRGDEQQAMAARAQAIEAEAGVDLSDPAND